MSNYADHWSLLVTTADPHKAKLIKELAELPATQPIVIYGPQWGHAEQLRWPEIMLEPGLINRILIDPIDQSKHDVEHNGDL